MLHLFNGEDFTCQIKYDGLRAQLHRLSDGSLRVYSRHLEDTSSQWPDLNEYLLESVNVKQDERISQGLASAAAKEKFLPFIIDAEVVAIEWANDDERIKHTQRQHARPLLEQKQEASACIPASASSAVLALLSSPSSEDASSRSSSSLCLSQSSPNLFSALTAPSSIGTHESAPSFSEAFRILPFQVLSGRARKYGTHAPRSDSDLNKAPVGQVSVMIYIFDLLFVDGRPIIDLSLVCASLLIWL